MKMVVNMLVIGPHRSGTTIVAKCLAHDRGALFVPEEDVHYASLDLIAAYLEFNTVIQCPWAAPFVHELGCDVTWVNRPREEIYDSRARMKKQCGDDLLWFPNNRKLRHAYNAESDPRDIIDIQLDHWQASKHRFSSYKEVNYHDFEGHPLWVDSREHFHFRQTA